MLLDERFRKAALYVVRRGTDRRAQGKLCGTAFIVGVGLDNDDPGQTKFGEVQYAVTASHVVANAFASEEIFLRVNTLDGATLDVPLPKESWIHHPDTDVAVIPIDWPHASVELDVMSFSLNHLLTKIDSEKHFVSAGDEVVVLPANLDSQGLRI